MPDPRRTAPEPAPEPVAATPLAPSPAAASSGPASLGAVSAGRDYSSVGPATWLLQISTGRWDPSTPIPALGSPPSPRSSERLPLNLATPDPLDTSPAPEQSPEFPPRPGSAAEFLSRLRDDWMRNQRSMGLAAGAPWPGAPSPGAPWPGSPSPSSSLADAIGALNAAGLSNSIGAAIPPPTASSASSDRSALESALAAAVAAATSSGISGSGLSPDAPTDAMPDPSIDPSQVDPPDTAWPGTPAPLQIDGVVLRPPPGVDTDSPPSTWPGLGVKLLPFDPATDSVGITLLSQPADSLWPGGAASSRSPQDQRTAAALDRLFRRPRSIFDNYLDDPQPRPSRPGLLDIAHELESPQGRFTSSAGDNPQAAPGAGSTAPGAGNAASGGFSFGPPPHLVVELAQADDKLLEAIRASPALFDARMRELILQGINQRDVTPGAQRATTR